MYVIKAALSKSFENYLTSEIQHIEINKESTTNVVYSKVLFLGLCYLLFMYFSIFNSLMFAGNKNYFSRERYNGFIQNDEQGVGIS